MSVDSILPSSIDYLEPGEEVRSVSPKRLYAVRNSAGKIFLVDAASAREALQSLGNGFNVCGSLFGRLQAEVEARIGKCMAQEIVSITAGRIQWGEDVSSWREMDD